MTALRVRWATGPGDKPRPGEALGRLERVPGFQTKASYPGAGQMALALQVDSTGAVRRSPDARPTDLHVTRAQMQMVVVTSGDRRIVARFGLDVDAPQVDADAPADLRDAVVRLWRRRKPTGPPPGRGDITIGRIRETLREYAEPWPPSQPELGAAMDGCSTSRIRQVLHAAHTDYDTEITAAERDRLTTS